MVGDSDATRASIKALLHPSTIAIAGASSDPGKLGSLPLAFLVKHGYAGAIYPVHPKLDEISGLRCFRSMAEVAADVDLLVIAVPAARIVDLLNDCRPGQVKSALILSSGFAETGPEGIALQQELRNKAFEKGIRFIGPNSVGVANLHEKVSPSISQVFDQAGLARRIGLPSERRRRHRDPALAHAEQIGIGYFLSTGNGDLELGTSAFLRRRPRVGIIAYSRAFATATNSGPLLPGGRDGKPVADQGRRERSRGEGRAVAHRRACRIGRGLSRRVRRARHRPHAKHRGIDRRAQDHVGLSTRVVPRSRTSESRDPQSFGRRRGSDGRHLHRRRPGP
jgi:predicted CoA-binding protein